MSKNAKSLTIEVAPELKKQMKVLQESQVKLETMDNLLKAQRKKDWQEEQLGLGVHGKVKTMFKLKDGTEYEVKMYDDDDSKKMELPLNPM